MSAGGGGGAAADDYGKKRKATTQEEEEKETDTQRLTLVKARMEELFTCHICCDIMIYPLTGRCGHSFCTVCYFSSVEAKTETRNGKFLPGSREMVECPSGCKHMSTVDDAVNVIMLRDACHSARCHYCKGQSFFALSDEEIARHRSTCSERRLLSPHCGTLYSAATTHDGCVICTKEETRKCMVSRLFDHNKTTRCVICDAIMWTAEEGIGSDEIGRRMGQHALLFADHHQDMATIPIIVVNPLSFKFTTSSVAAMFTTTGDPRGIFLRATGSNTAEYTKDHELYVLFSAPLWHGEFKLMRLAQFQLQQRNVAASGMSVVTGNENGHSFHDCDFRGRHAIVTISRVGSDDVPVISQTVYCDPTRPFYMNEKTSASIFSRVLKQDNSKWSIEVRLSATDL
jgi:hypothetical protein